MTDILRGAGPWTPKEDGPLRSMVAAGEASTRLQSTADSVRRRAHLKIRLACVRLGRRNDLHR
jgi:hypothetical protein